MKQSLVLTLLMSLFGTTATFAQHSLSAYAFLDYFYNVQRDPAIGTLQNTALNGPAAFHTFSFRHIYFTYDKSISKEFSGRLRLEADESALSSDGKISVFVKDAHVKWRGVFEGHDLILGVQPTPAVQLSEEWWGYRSLQKSILDLRGVVSSRDFGLSLKGKLLEKGRFGYQILLANGAGNRPVEDKFKRYYISLRYYPSTDLQITLYGDLRARTQIRNPYGPISAPLVRNNSLTYAAFIGYRLANELTTGIEAFQSTTQNGFDTKSALTGRTAAGVSIFGSWMINSRFTMIGRYDYFDANTSAISPGDMRSYAIAAIDWRVNESVSIMPNIQFESYESIEGRAYDPSVTLRVTTYFAF